MIAVKIYSKAGCHLCEEALADLEALQRDYPHNLEIIDIDQQANLPQSLQVEVPVIEVGPYRLKAPFTRQELAITLGAARDRQAQIDALKEADYSPTDPASMTWTKSDRFTHWLSSHYLALLNMIVLVYLALPVLAPVLMKVGLETPARIIYRGYGFVCHQLAFRSFFLFGEQLVYPRAAAGLAGLSSLQQATGLDEASGVDALLAASRFVGNDVVGYKIALCERDMAIYGSIFLFGIIFALTGRRLKALPWYIWVLVGLVPIGLDGLSQLLSQPPFSFWAFRESTPYFRVITGFLFGFTTAWFGYPLVEQAMADSRQLMAAKYRRTHRSISDTNPVASGMSEENPLP
jgi:uncharacterized membrane protein